MALGFGSISINQLAERWWVPVVRGIAAIAFGILVIVYPAISLFALIMLWGAYALVDGVFNLVMAARRGRAGGSWGWLVFEGIVSIVVGVLAFAWPAMTALALLMVIAAWAVLTGIAEIAAAIRLRKEIQGEWLLGLGGALSILFGVLLVVFPGAGALAMLWMISAYSIVFGAVMIGLGLRLNSWRRRSSGERRITTGGVGTEIPITS